MRSSFAKILLLLALGGLPCAFAQSAGFLIPEQTLSPDGAYGVTVPLTAEIKEEANPANSLIAIRTGRILAPILAKTAWDHANHETILPARWSRDSSLLIWEVDGKWAPRALVVLQLKNDTVAWQANLLAQAQQAILERTKKAAPEKYAAAKKANAGHGSAYPEGFTIDVAVLDPTAFPLRIKAALTSNPKGIPDLPTLESNLDATLDQQGRFTVQKFSLRPGQSSHF